MLTQEQSVEIHVLHKQGMGIRRISRELNISRNTVRRYLRHYITIPEYKARAARPSKLDPFKPYILERIEAAKPHWIPATVLFREIKSMGYQGKISRLRSYIRPFKSSTNDPVVRFETEPGEQLQVDFTTIQRGKNKLKAFVATLGYSRATFVKFSTHERQEDWLQGIKEALLYFGGVPKEILFDNAKCIMLERDAYGAGKHRWNPQLLALASEYGFKPRVCKPYRAKTKGKVERFNGYLKQSFITPLAASLKQAGLALDVDHANAHIGKWLAEVANIRIHGTTGKQPTVLLEQERIKLLPLPVNTPSAVRLEPSQSLSIIPIESLQHPLSTYDQLLGATQ